MSRLKDFKPDQSKRGTGEFFVKIVYEGSDEPIANFASTSGLIERLGIDYFVETEDFGWTVRMLVTPGGVVVQSLIFNPRDQLLAVGDSGTVQAFHHNPPSASCDRYETVVYKSDDPDNRKIIVSGRFNFA